MKGKYLITTDEWFYAPDGRKYKSAWGEVKILDDSILGLKTNRNNTNWCAQVGAEGREMIIAGCCIHYAVKCEIMPDNKNVRDVIYGDNGIKQFDRSSEIYIAEKTFSIDELKNIDCVLEIEEDYNYLPNGKIIVRVNATNITHYSYNKIEEILKSSGCDYEIKSLEL